MTLTNTPNFPPPQETPVPFKHQSARDIAHISAYQTQNGCGRSYLCKTVLLDYYNYLQTELTQNSAWYKEHYGKLSTAQHAHIAEYKCIFLQSVEHTITSKSSELRTVLGVKPTTSTTISIEQLPEHIQQQIGDIIAELWIQDANRTAIKKLEPLPHDPRSDTQGAWNSFKNFFTDYKQSFEPTKLIIGPQSVYAEFRHRLPESCTDYVISIKPENPYETSGYEHYTNKLRQEEAFKNGTLTIPCDVVPADYVVNKAVIESAPQAHAITKEAVIERIEKTLSVQGDMYRYTETLTALHETHSNEKKLYEIEFKLNDDQKKLLESYGCSIEDFARFLGNPLQAEYHQEMVELIGAASDITYLYQSPETNSFSEVAVKLLSLAHKYNTQEEMSKTAATVNLSSKLLNGAYTCGKALANGIVSGVSKTLDGYRQCITHPIATTYECAQALAGIADATQLFVREVSCNYYQAYNNGHFIEKFTSDLTVCTGICTKIAYSLWEMPTERLIEEGADIVAQYLSGKYTNTLLTKLGGFVQRELKESQYIKKVLERTKSTADALRLGLQHKLETAIARYKFTLKSSLETALQKIESAEVGGCLQTLDHAYDLFHETPGFEAVLKNVIEGASGFDPGDIGRAKGAFYEFKKAVELQAKGEKIIHLGLEIQKRDFDIITTTKMIECKNITWKFPNNDVINKKKSIFW